MKRNRLMVLCAVLLMTFCWTAMAAGSADDMELSGDLGKSYTVYKWHSEKVSVLGGEPDYTFEVSGDIPSGFEAFRDGADFYLEGTPDTIGTWTFTLSVTDSLGAYIEREYSATVEAEIPSENITISGSFDNGYTVRTWYSDNVSVSGGFEDYTFNITSGDLPPGFYIRKSGRDFYLEGVPGSAGTWPFTLRITDRHGKYAEKEFSVSMLEGGPASGDMEMLGSFDKGYTASNWYSGYVMVSGDSGSYTFSTSGDIPPGFRIRQSGAYFYLEGMPGSAGTWTFTLRVTDSRGMYIEKDYSVTMLAGGPASGDFVISSDFIDGYTVSNWYSSGVEVSGDSGGYTFSISSGDIPPGFYLRKNGQYMYLEGIPNTAGKWTFTLKVTDSHGMYTEKDYSVNIIAERAASGDMEIVGDFSDGYTVSSWYSDYVTVSGDVDSYTFSVSSSDLPPGFYFRQSEGSLYLEGIPSKAGAWKFTLRITDSTGKYAERECSVNIIAERPASGDMEIVGDFSDGYTVSNWYSDYVTVSGDVDSYTFSVSSGDLPPGFYFRQSEKSLYLEGIPDTAGTWPFTLRITDNLGRYAEKECSVNIIAERAASGDMEILGSFDKGYTASNWYSDSVTLSGDNDGYTFSITSGDLPPGFYIRQSGQEFYLEGIPDTAGTWPFTLQVTDSTGKYVEQDCSVTIDAEMFEADSSDMYLYYNGTLNLSADVGAWYSSGNIYVSGGVSGYSFVINGELPKGLYVRQVSSSYYYGNYFLIEGVPTEAGTHTFVLRVIDRRNAYAEKSLTINVSEGKYSAVSNDTFEIIGDYTGEVKVNGSYSAEMSLTNYSGYDYNSFRWSVTDGTLPPGMYLSPSYSTVTLAGILNTSGDYTFTLRGALERTSYSYENGEEITLVSHDYTERQLTIRVIDAPYEASGDMSIEGAADSADVKVNEEYSDSFTVSGYEGSVLATVSSGDLPPELSVSRSYSYYSGYTFYLSGRPNTAGDYAFTLRFTDNRNAYIEQPFTLRIHDTPYEVSGDMSIEGAADSADVKVNGQYSDSFTVSGYEGSVLATVSSGDLPSGLSVSRSGSYYSNYTFTLSGRPNTAGDYAFTLRFTDNRNAYIEQPFILRIHGTPYEVSGDMRIEDAVSSADVKVNGQYSDSFTVSGYDGSVLAIVASGDVPPGLSVSRSGGYYGNYSFYLSGKLNTAGTYAFTLRFIDDRNAYVDKSFVITVHGTPYESSGMSIAGTSGAINWKVNEEFSTSFTVRDYSGNVHAVVESGDIPPGLSVSNSGGNFSISGIPNTSGDYTFTLRIVDGKNAYIDKTINITIHDTTYESSYMRITGVTQSADWKMNEAYSDYFYVRNYKDSLYVTVVSGDLPPGLSVTNSGGSIRIHGTPHKAGTYTFTLRMTDKRNSYIEQELTIRIHATPYSAPDTAVTGEIHGNWKMNEEYSDSFTVDGYVGGLNAIVMSGDLPPGLSLRNYEGTFTLYGIPNKAGTYTFTVRFTDDRNAYVDQTFTVKINDVPYLDPYMSFTGEDTEELRVNESYVNALNVSGYTGTVHMSVIKGSLPPGISLSNEYEYYDEDSYSYRHGWALYGILNKGGTYSFILRATDSRNAYTDKVFTIKVNDTPYEDSSMSIRADLRKEWNTNEHNAVSMQVMGYKDSVHMTVTSGEIPPGLALRSYEESNGNYSTCEIFGIPRKPGSYTFTLRATDIRNAYVEKALTLVVSGDEVPDPKESNLMMLTDAFSDGYTNRTWYSSSVAVSGGLPIYSALLAKGSLPPGFYLRRGTSAYGSGTIFLEGIPDTAGKYTFTLRAIDRNNTYTEREYTVNIKGLTLDSGDMSITGTLPDAYTVDPWYSNSLKVTGGYSSYTFNITSGDLPEGFYIRQDGSTFNFEGIPTKPGTYAFTFRVTDWRNNYTERELSFDIHGVNLATPEPQEQLALIGTSLKNAVTGRSYTQSVEFDGWATSWKVTDGTLPPGLTLNASTGEISGIVSHDALEHNSYEAKDYTFTVAVSNDQGVYVEQLFTISVTEPVELTDISELPNAQAFVPYETILTANGTSLGGMTWYVDDLPSGLWYTANGRSCFISGTPDRPGTYRVYVYASNGRTSESREYMFTVKPAPVPVSITTDGLLPAGTGREYSQELKAEGTVTVWSVFGELPEGLSLDSTTGIISGTVPDSVVTRIFGSSYSRASTYDFMVIASNDSGAYDTKTLSITAYEPARIVDETLPGATAGVEYSAEVFGGGYWGEYVDSKSGYWDTVPTLWLSGDVPAWLEYSQTDAGSLVLKGIPKTAGDYSVSVCISNGWSSQEKVFTLSVAAKPASALKPVIILPKTSTKAYAGSNYAMIPTVNASTPATWSVTGTLPPGLALNQSTGEISGTLQRTDAGKSAYNYVPYTFMITAANSAGTDTAKVYIPVWYPPEFATVSALPDASKNTAYSADITVEGTEYTMQWKKLSGKLPKGLTLTMNRNKRTATITGSPANAGTFVIALEVSNLAGTSRVRIQRTFTLIVKEDTAETGTTPVITTTNLPNGETGTSYVAVLNATGQKPITWSKSGVLPKGLKMDKYGTISGIPSKPGTYTFTLKAANEAGTDSKSFTVTVTGEASKKPKIKTSKLPEAAVNMPYSTTLEAEGTDPITWTFANTKYPSGLYITEDGTITGIPKEAGKFTIKVKAENNVGSAVKSYSITVAGIQPTIVNASLPSGTAGTAYSARLLAEGSGTIRWSRSGELPEGLTFNASTGEISGTPAAAGTYSFTVTAKSKYGSETRAFVIVIAAAADASETPETLPETHEAATEGTEILPETAQDYPQPETFGHESEIDMWVVSGDEEVRGEIYVPEGQPVTFMIAEELEGAEVYIADEAIAIEVDGDSFTLPSELVYDEFVIYVKAGNSKTIELYIVAEKEE